MVKVCMITVFLKGGFLASRHSPKTYMSDKLATLTVCRPECQRGCLFVCMSCPGAILVTPGSSRLFIFPLLLPTVASEPCNHFSWQHQAVQFYKIGNNTSNNIVFITLFSRATSDTAQ